MAHSAEGGALCFITACREGQKLLGAHMHPEIVVSAIPMSLSMAAWKSGNYELVANVLLRGIEQVASAGAEFFICPDNTAHIVLERCASRFPIPGLHIADVVCESMLRHGWRNAGLLGTNWTMTGPVYADALRKRGLGLRVPDPSRREQIDRAIFDELCRAEFKPPTIEMFIAAIRELEAAGADCAILGCTEIPLIIDERNSPLPVLDSTRLLATAAVRVATTGRSLNSIGGWLVGDQLVES